MTKRPFRPFVDMLVIDVTCPDCGRGFGQQCLDADAKSLFAFGGDTPAHLCRWECLKAVIERRIADYFIAVTAAEIVRSRGQQTELGW